MNARIRTARDTSETAGPGVLPTAALRWLDERFVAVVSFRLRLLKMAFQPVDRIPAQVIMALESRDSEASELLDPDTQSARIGPVR